MSKRRPSPAVIAIAPRAWLTRRLGECAFPVAGAGYGAVSCCNPCGPRIYCEAHRAVMAGPAAQPIAALEQDLRRMGL